MGSDTASVSTVVTFTNPYAAGTAGATKTGAQLAASGFTATDRLIGLLGVLSVMAGIALVVLARPRRRTES